MSFERLRNVAQPLLCNPPAPSFSFLSGPLLKMPLATDLLYPDPSREREIHKLSRLVPHPNSYFMDVKCPNCPKIVTAFSHATTVITCPKCQTVLCTPSGGKAIITDGCSFRRKAY